MYATRQTKPFAMLMIAASLCLGGAGAFAADAAPAKAAPPPPKQAPPSKEMREKMALMHEKMAACLRSDRPVPECRDEMMKSCHDAGEQMCGKMHDGHKMMMHDEAAHDHDHSKPAEAPPAKP